MRRLKSRLEGQMVTLMPSYAEYPFTGKLEKIFLEPNDPDLGALFYEVRISPTEVCMVAVNDVQWITTKKRVYKHLNVVENNVIKLPVRSS